MNPTKRTVGVCAIMAALSLCAVGDAAETDSSRYTVDAMADAGIGAAIFDWYRYDDGVDGGRMLEGALEPDKEHGTACLDEVRAVFAAKAILERSQNSFNKQNAKDFDREINPIIIEHNRMAVKSILREPGRAPAADAATFPAAGATARSDWEHQFQAPPLSARLRAFWVWMGTDISKEGITKDLEAMREAGLGGAEIMHVGSPISNSPWPDRKYRGEYYWEALSHAAAEADRLGLKLSLFNGPGYTGTGGPWIDEGRTMRKLVWSSVKCSAGTGAEIVLPRPPKSSAKFYEEIAVLAVPDRKTVRRDEVVDLTAKLQADGTLNWARPAGPWVVYRIGSTPTLKSPHPIDASFGRAFEVDKLSEADNLFHWQRGVIEPLKQHLGKYYGTSFNGLHVDSYECGPQNWTRTFREAFTQRKGYDPVPWLATFGPPVLGWPPEKQNGGPQTGLPRNELSKFIDSEEKTLRFEWDFRENVNRMYNDCFKAAKRLMNADKVLFSYEPYAGPFNSSEAAAGADLPMATFWFVPNLSNHDDYTGGGTAQGARAAGVKIIGAEAFTGGPNESRWTECPSLMKFQADGAFAGGINQLTLHHWTHQPFDDQYQPGMSFSHYGVHFGRFQTWFEPGKALFQYVNRCQFLLQQGEEVVDGLNLDKSAGHCDVISSHDFVNDKTRVEHGQIVLGSGRRYFYLSVPGGDLYQSEPGGDTMLPEVAEKLLRLVQAGAVIVAPHQPVRSPSLKDYPECDRRLAAAARELWKSGRYAKNVFATVSDAAKALGWEPDYIVPDTMKVLHRRSADGDIYFVAHRATTGTHARVSFRVAGRQPELWQPEDAGIIEAPVWERTRGRTTVQLDLGPRQSIFVVFRRKINTRVHPTALVVNETVAEWRVAAHKDGSPMLCAADNLTAHVEYSDGKTTQERITGGKQLPLAGAWRVSFSPRIGARFDLEFPELVDFSKHPENKVRYFSGTAAYRKEFKVDALRENEGVLLDLGELNDIASVRVNGGENAVLWYPPYRLDIGKHLHAGNNLLEVSVVNTWANAIIGDERIPADFSVKPNWSGCFMTAYPAWFLNGQQRPSARKTFTFPANYYNTQSKPVPAGLGGPVILRFQQNVRL